ncbi:RICIN domain-containing protein [Mucilaginibacter sp. SMC90]|uniref:RICIN domain-containing protein n=1 Tax=Mucilaginibacter sp. SMC90 TaxID=2929803 RepID=UPI001FB2D5A9|nr:RICIN domain-containing protein [Mucilaginibacter sp. SMC90]UOE50033.1 RICIN domain-containing protein [Mucilaginibacter sp. SMC90]
MKTFALLICFLLPGLTVMAQQIKGTYAIKNEQTGMLLRVKDARAENGTPLVAYYPENWKCMTWDFQHVGGNTYKLKNLFTSKTFQPVAEATAGVALEEQPLNTDNATQQYEFEPIDKDTFLIKLKGTDLYLTPSDKKGSVNSKIILAKKTNTKDQYWDIYQQSPTM